MCGSRKALHRSIESRRPSRQVLDSLVAAAGRQPDSFTVVTPMVPTPEERMWSEGLRADYPLVME